MLNNYTKEVMLLMGFGGVVKVLDLALQQQDFQN